jgi:hypothetical protein
LCQRETGFVRILPQKANLRALPRFAGITAIPQSSGESRIPTNFPHHRRSGIERFLEQTARDGVKNTGSRQLSAGSV